MAETADFSQQEALVERYTETMTYVEACQRVGLPYTHDGHTEATYEEQPRADSEPRRSFGRAAEPGDHAYELSQSLRPSTEVLADPVPAKGSGYNEARLMADAIGSKNWTRVRELLRAIDEKTDSDARGNKVA